MAVGKTSAEDPAEVRDGPSALAGNPTAPKGFKTALMFASSI
ncbi:Hypothetical protein Bdt_2754 [Bdellovibrio bacteriovorus str. Tiberius]|uniref:Uncharacterized protein n=1 Tax=Bdellovibrio bacteriovorus str. Tiberius TaxID=1069642 RepID=K7Z0B7_BDEBC|nr:Hypothetical protein Bdt_2754 [Bdellovibrio bacteriovorus str. Tiberius]